MKSATLQGTNDPLAYQMPQMETTESFEVTSPAFHDSERIPLHFSGYGENMSPPLAWVAGPEGTKSYAIAMEDPDAPVVPLPVVHWLAWNIPADTLKLDQRLPVRDELTRPRGMRQGINVRGKPGYTGPKPPEGDPPHCYNLQVFALDCFLDLPGGSNRLDFLEASAGHVMAAGILAGKFAWPVAPAGS